MTLEIEVMYADLSRVRAPIDDAYTLNRTGVLFMILSAPTTEGKARTHIQGVPYRRVREVHGTDYYAVLRQEGRVLLAGWDAKAFPWVSIADPFNAAILAEKMCSWPQWLPKEALVFKGTTLSMEDWKQALEAFKDMH